MSRTPTKPKNAKLSLRKKQIRTLSGARLDDARGGADFHPTFTTVTDTTPIAGNSAKVGVGGTSAKGGSARASVGG